jgi:serine beta-lactamase-like protein LACTB, mitochondrial
MKILPALLFALFSTALLSGCDAILTAYKLTARRVHAEPADVPSQGASPSDPRFAGAAEEIRRLARELVAADNLPGLSIAIGMDDRLVWAEGVGWAHIASRQPITPETLFRIGTASKPLTAAGVGLLVERGLLDLDAPVQRYLPAFPYKDAPLSTRQAMAHTAGFRHHRGQRDYLPQRRCDNLQQALDQFADDRLEFTPGTRWSFSTYGWILVSAVAEAAAGEPLDAFLAREVFAPLAMHSTLPDSADQPDPRRAGIYWPRARRDTSYGLEHPTEVDYSCFAGAGIYLSTPSDLVRFGLAMNSHGLLSPATTALLQTPVELPSGMSTGHGLGWFVEQVAFEDMATTLIGHPGIAVGATTSFRRYPEHGLVVVVSSNVSFAELAPFAARAAAVFAAARRGADAREGEGHQPRP